MFFNIIKKISAGKFKIMILLENVRKLKKSNLISPFELRNTLRSLGIFSL
jgi:hypothetical protein